MAFVRLNNSTASNRMKLHRPVAVVLVAVALHAPSASQIPHPCDVLDRATAELLIGVPTREPRNGRSRHKEPEYTVAGCIYFSAKGALPGTAIVRLFEYEFPSQEAAKRTFAENRTRLLDQSFTWENKVGIGDAASLSRSEDALGLFILRGKKILQLEVNRHGWKSVASLPERFVSLGVRATATLAP
jgi:hypothetical protein